ncbi:MAG: Uma2 family endonuclease [Deltaproteobacteria bacterium]|nr:Uma2 family endonuclease [Deltaproteobacteria bacterium]
MDPPRKVPTIADLEALPSGVKGEIIDGVMYTMTRPRGRHQRMERVVSSRIGDPFDDGRDGPGGWWILPEPGIELPNTPEIAPDVAGWRRERLLELPADAPIRVVPDWVCEILSPTTRRHNVLIKKPYYASVGVPHHWLVDLEAKMVTAYRLERGLWVELGVWGDERDARIEPFDAVALDVASWWL